MAGEHGFTLRRVLRRPPLPPLRTEQRGWIELTFGKVSPWPWRATARTSPACAEAAAGDPA
jgi:hypothetical protein